MTNRWRFSRKFGWNANAYDSRISGSKVCRSSVRSAWAASWVSGKERSFPSCSTRSTRLVPGIEAASMGLLNVRFGNARWRL